MKKYILTLALIALVIPSVALASWWNPFSWFDNWTFRKTDKTEILEQRIQELESRLESSEEKYLEETTPKAETPTTDTNPVSTTKEKKTDNTLIIPPPATITPVVNIVTKTIDPYEVRCKLNSERDIKKGDSRTAILSSLDFGISNYDVDWDKKHLTKIIDFNEASFTFNSIGDIEVFATVTRKKDGAKGKVTCLETYLSCNEYSCLDNRGKKINKLQAILDEIDRWYDGAYPNLSPVDRCYISESIIRAIEYDYTLIGGTNLPVFSKTADCANSVAPKAYQYKIELLKETL